MVSKRLAAGVLSVLSLSVLVGHYIQDEGVARPVRQGGTNFIGAGVSCVDNAGSVRTDCTIAGGGGGGGNAVSVTLAFGADGSDTASTVVTGQAWVTGTSIIACAPTLLASSPWRIAGSEDAVIEGLVVAIHTRVAGTGFTLTGGPRLGRAIGDYIVHCIGV